MPAVVGAQLQDTFPLHVAAHKALTAQARGKLATTSLHTELVFNMSGSKHVSLCSNSECDIILRTLC